MIAAVRRAIALVVGIVLLVFTLGRVQVNLTGRSTVADDAGTDESGAVTLTVPPADRPDEP